MNSFLTVILGTGSVLCLLIAIGIALGKIKTNEKMSRARGWGTVLFTYTGVMLAAATGLYGRHVTALYGACFSIALGVLCVLMVVVTPRTGTPYDRATRVGSVALGLVFVAIGAHLLL